MRLTLLLFVLAITTVAFARIPVSSPTSGIGGPIQRPSGSKSMEERPSGKDDKSRAGEKPKGEKSKTEKGDKKSAGKGAGGGASPTGGAGGAGAGAGAAGAGASDGSGDASATDGSGDASATDGSGNASATDGSGDGSESMGAEPTSSMPDAATGVSPSFALAAALIAGVFALAALV